MKKYLLVHPWISIKPTYLNLALYFLDLNSIRSNSQYLVYRCNSVYRVNVGNTWRCRGLKNQFQLNQVLDFRCSSSFVSYSCSCNAVSAPDSISKQWAFYSTAYILNLQCCSCQINLKLDFNRHRFWLMSLFGKLFGTCYLILRHFL